MRRKKKIKDTTEEKKRKVQEAYASRRRQTSAQYNKIRDMLATHHTAGICVPVGGTDWSDSPVTILQEGKIYRCVACVQYVVLILCSAFLQQ